MSSSSSSSSSAVQTTPRSKRIALFITCLSDQFYPQVGVAVTRILERLGYTVEFPQAQTCCGQPFFNNGFHPEAARLGKRFIEIFEGYDHIVSPSGSCVAMVREQYHELFQHDPAWGPRMEAVRHRTYEFVEFLNDIAKFDASQLTLPTGDRFTYHYTCHLRGLGIKDEGVRMLRAIGGVDFTPLEKTDQCCGFGGTFAIKYPEISGAIVEDKVRNIRDTKANVTICNDAGCTMNISGMCHRGGVDTRVTHIAEVMAQAMGIELPQLG
jgi:L-lactate dehydrogenase complex protein LldE